MTLIRRFAWVAAISWVLLGTSLAVTTAHAASPTRDSEITSELTARLRQYDPDMASLIRVSTTDGVVTLTGYARTTAAIAKASRLAWSVEGVAKVENHIALIDY